MQQVAKKHTAAVQRAKKATTATMQFMMKPFAIRKPAKTATSSQGATTTPEVQQLIADLIQKGPDPHIQEGQRVQQAQEN